MNEREYDIAMTMCFVLGFLMLINNVYLVFSAPEYLRFYTVILLLITVNSCFWIAMFFYFRKQKLIEGFKEELKRLKENDKTNSH